MFVHPLHPPKEMELMKSHHSTPYMSAPSSPPHPLNLFFYSTPSSPRLSSHRRLSFLDDDPISIFCHEHETSEPPSLSIPFDWEVTPGIPKSAAATEEEFEFSGHLVRPALSSADELFDGGKIRALKPPPRLLGMHTPPDSPKSPKSPVVNKFKDVLSMSPKKWDKPSVDPFEAALNNSPKVQGRGRGRGRGRARRGRDPVVGIRHGTSTSRKCISRSLSPLRVSEFAMLNHHQQVEDSQNLNDKSSSLSSSSSSKKWRLKDLFLFRSSSEGKKYSFLSRRDSMDNDDESYSFRLSTSGAGLVSKQRGGDPKISAHEMHYTAKKAVCEGMKMKTTLPYRHALLGCLGFAPILEHLSL